MGYYVFTYSLDSSDPEKRVWSVGQPFDASPGGAIAALEMNQRQEMEGARKEGRTPIHIRLWKNVHHFVLPKSPEPAKKPTVG